MATLDAKALQGETLDALVWRVLGAGSGVVEQVYALNRDLAALGPILPEGTPVILPVLVAETAPQRDIIQLWE